MNRFLVGREQGFIKVVTGLCLMLYLNIASAQDPQELFEKAIAERASGNVQVAIQYFQTILSNQPELQRARLELAVAYLQALNFSRAREHAKEVLNAPDTPEAVKQKIREFLVRVDLSSPKHTWTPRASLGFIYDSNVNAGPDDNVLSAFPVGTVVSEISDNALQLKAGVSHRYISGRNLGMIKSKPAFLWLSQANVYWTDYQSENDYDLSIVSLSTGPSFIAANAWRAGVNIQLDQVDLGNNNYGLFLSAHPSLTVTPDQGKTEVTVDAIMQDRNYKRAVDVGRDSKYYAAGISMGHVMKRKGFSVQEGLRIFNEDAKSVNLDNDGNEVFVGMNWRGSPHTNIYIRAARRNKSFDSPAIADEKQNRYVVGFNHAFSSSVLKNWVVKASFTQTDNQSNDARRDYNRSQTGISLGRAF